MAYHSVCSVATITSGAMTVRVTLNPEGIPMKDCNNCEFTGRCKPTKLHKCNRYVAPAVYKNTILHHLVFSGKVNQAADVLHKFNLRVVDITEAPYFRLEPTN
jgi:hypothetical protein